MRQRRLFTPSSPPASRTTGNTLSLDDFVFHVYLPHIKVYKRSWRTDARIASRHISSSFGARPLARIRRGEIEDWLRGLRERGFAPASCNRFLAVLKTIYTVAENRGFLRPGQSPCRGISGFRASAQKERYLSRHEAERLMRALKDSSHPHANALQLLLLTGARKNEILKARWENMDLERGMLTIPVSKSGSARHIVLSDAALEVIKNLPRTESPWLFRDKPRARPFLTSIFSGTAYAGSLACAMSASMTCATHLPVFLLTLGTRSMRSKKCWATPTRVRPCVMPILNRRRFGQLLRQ